MSYGDPLEVLTRRLLDVEARLNTLTRLTQHAPLHAGQAKLTEIVAGSIAVTRPWVQVTPQSGTADDLDEITGGSDGKMIVISTAQDGDTITVTPYTLSGGNIDLRGSGNGRVLADPHDSIFLIYRESTGHWEQVGPDTLNSLVGVALTAPADGDVLTYDDGTGNWVNAPAAGGGVDTFLELTDTPAAYTGEAGNVVAVNGTETGLEFISPPASLPPDPHAPTHLEGGSDPLTTTTPAANGVPQADIAGKLANGWLDATLEAIGNLTGAADKGILFTGVDTVSLIDISAFALTILDDANQAAVQATLALVPGTNVQAFDATLATIAALDPTTNQSIYFTATNVAATYSLTAYGRTLAALADAAALRTSAGLIAGGAGDIWVEKAGDSMSGPLNMGTQLINNVATPVSAGDAATKSYVDGVVEGLDVKASVRAATTANITLSAPQTIDGVAVIAGDRVLVKNQSTAANNGIYVVAAGAWARSADANVSAEVTSGMYTFVTEGTVNGNTGWALTTDDPITLGTTALVFSQFSGAINIAAAIDNAGETTTPVSANKFALVVSGVLTWLSYSNLLATLTTAFNALYVALTGNQTIAGNKTFTGTTTVGSLISAPLASGVYSTLLGWLSTYTLAPGSLTTAQVWTIDILIGTGNDRQVGNWEISFACSSGVNDTWALIYKAHIGITRAAAGANGVQRSLYEMMNYAVGITLTGPTPIANGIRYTIQPTGGTFTRTAGSVIGMAPNQGFAVTSVVA